MAHRWAYRKVRPYVLFGYTWLNKISGQITGVTPKVSMHPTQSIQLLSPNWIADPILGTYTITLVFHSKNEEELSGFQE